MDPTRRNSLIGGALVLVGVALFVLQFVEGLTETVIFLAVGGAFLAAYFYRRSYGMLVPGCILLGLGLGGIGESIELGISNFSGIGLGLGFVAIYVIHLLHTGRSSWWPLVPGVVLIGGGLVSSSRTVARLLERGWPLLLVVAGAVIWSRAEKRREQPPPE